MKNLEKFQLYNGLNHVSLKYKSINYKLEENYIYSNTKLQNNIKYYKNNIESIKNRANLISTKCKELVKNSNPNEIINTMLELNNFSK